MTPGAVVVGAHANGLGVIRALAARRVPVAAVSTRAFDIAHRSRHVSEWHPLPELHENRETLVDLLDRHADRWRGWAVFPTNDDALTALAQHHERLSRSYRLTIQPWDIVADLVEKDRMHALAQRVGLDVPACHGPATPANAARAGLTLPLVVKPLRHDRLITALGTKAFVVRDRAELHSAVARLAALDVPGLLFDFVEGSDAEIFVHGVYLSARGEPSEGITLRKLRQNPPEIGSARVVEVVRDVPGLREATIELLRRARFHGMAFAEFKRNRHTGRFQFIEVNGRPVLFNAVLPPTGIDLVAATWADQVLGEPTRLQRTGWRGAWIHLQADLVCSWMYRRGEQLGAAGFLAPYRGPKVWAVWSANDPRPFLAQTRLLAHAAARRASMSLRSALASGHGAGRHA